MDEVKTKDIDPNSVWIPSEEMKDYLVHMKAMLATIVNGIESTIQSVDEAVLNNQGDTNDDN